MTVYGVITAAVVRKISALIAEYRKLVAEASVIEKRIILRAKTEAKQIIAEAKAETAVLKSDLIDKIAKI
jgi:hypothetical protein